MRLWAYVALLVAGIGALIFSVVVVAGFWLKGRVVAQGKARGLEVTVESARVGWFAAHLRGVHVGFEGVPSIATDVESVDVEVDVRGRPTRIVVTKGTAHAKEDVEKTIAELRAWRERRPRLAATEGETTGPVIAATDFSVYAPLPGGGALSAYRVSFERDGTDVKVAAGEARAERGETKLIASDVSVALAGKQLKSASVGALALELTLEKPSEASNIAAAPSASSAPEPVPLLPVVAEPVSKKDKKKKGAAATPTEPIRIALPDIAPLRGRAMIAARALADALAEGADLRVGALSAIVTSGKEKLGLGPGRAAIVRSPEHVELQFATEAAAPAERAPRDGARNTPLSLRIDLPTTPAAELRAQLSGGPITVSTLGVKEGAFGLMDVARAQLSGKATVKLDPQGTMTFDADLVARGLGLERAWLARAPVHGLDVGVRLAGVYENKKRIRIDDAEAALGAMRGRFKGTFESNPESDHLSASFEIPTSACQSLLDSVPEALVPTLRGAKLTGTFGALGRIDVDSRNLDELDLAYRFDDHCRFAEVPRAIDRERFRKPFFHRIIKPDGTEAEMETGPDSANWASLEVISPYMQAAVLTTEDGSFFRHHGFNHGAIKNSLIANLKARRFVRGASTISMQLAKNLFLSRQKTMSRKLEEVVLTEYLEQTFSKEELMELYLNVIEFGPNVYGIVQGAEHYFGRKPEELNVTECLFLASLLPRPVEAHKMYERGTVSEGWLRNLRALTEIAFRTGKISEAERNEALTQTIAFVKPGMPRPVPRQPMTGHGTGGDADWKALDY